jgi:hypothetical protein
MRVAGTVATGRAFRLLLQETLADFAFDYTRETARRKLTGTAKYFWARNSRVTIRLNSGGTEDQMSGIAQHEVTQILKDWTGVLEKPRNA